MKKRREDETQTERMPWTDEGRGWRAASASEGAARIVREHQAREGARRAPPLEHLEGGHGPADTLILDLKL